MINKKLIGTGGAGSTLASYLVIAAGGSGGNTNGGGGGAGGYRSSYPLDTYSGANSTIEPQIELESGVTYTATVGASGTRLAGGAVAQACGDVQSASALNGGNSSLSGSNIATIESIGGGRGGYTYGNSGGSGGGSAIGGGGGSGTAGQGFSGGQYSGGGGGGAGGSGAQGPQGLGGLGLYSTITGSSVGRASGGAGQGLYDRTRWDAFGGGFSPQSTCYDEPFGGGPWAFVNRNGRANTGSGGGSLNNGDNNYLGEGRSGFGGSGVVILRLPTSDYTGSVTGSPTVTTDGSDTVIIFNGTGTYTH